MDAGVVECEGFEHLVLNLALEMKGPVEPGGAVGAILIPDVAPYDRAYRVLQLVPAAAEISVPLEGSSAYLTARQLRVEIGFPRYRVLLWNSGRTAVTAAVLRLAGEGLNPGKPLQIPEERRAPPAHLGRKGGPAMRIRRALPLALALAAAPLGGCATILHGPNQTIHVETDPPGATVSVNGKRHTSPVDLVLKRSSKDLVVVIEKDGYATKKIALERATSRQTWLNFVGAPRRGAAAGAVDRRLPEQQLVVVGAGERRCRTSRPAPLLLPGLMFAVDGATGSIHRLDPPFIAVKLEPVPQAAAAATPTP